MLFIVGQVWWQTTEQCVHSRLYPSGPRLAVAQAEARPAFLRGGPYQSVKIPPDATMKPVNAPSSCSNHKDPDKTDTNGPYYPQAVAPHAHRCVVGAHDLCR